MTNKNMCVVCGRAISDREPRGEASDGSVSCIDCALPTSEQASARFVEALGRFANAARSCVAAFGSVAAPPPVKP